METLIILVLLFITAFLLIKIILFKRSLRQITRSIDEIPENDTNALIGTESYDKDISELCRKLNSSLVTLRQKEIKYQKGDTELKTAIAGISHDIRTPLTAIKGYTELLEKETDPKKRTEYIKIIKERTAALRQLSEELFDYSVTVSKESGGQKEEVYINMLLEECIATMYTSLSEKGITPEIELTDKKILKQADRAQVSRVFTNILSNAVKYSENDLKITLDENGCAVFSNKAENFSYSMTERLFDRFYTVRDERGSTGLGLSIAKTLCDKNGIGIKADYKNGRLYIILHF
ncbi:MAG: HAMP domain-containing histidine kinase [Ruminococcus sp.]|nr:HAMP domain-containing histidine kinase [Ruminococcus sp.]